MLLLSNQISIAPFSISVIEVYGLLHPLSLTNSGYFNDPFDSSSNHILSHLVDFEKVGKQRSLYLSKTSK